MAASCARVGLPLVRPAPGSLALPVAPAAAAALHHRRPCAPLVVARVATIEPPPSAPGPQQPHGEEESSGVSLAGASRPAAAEPFQLQVAAEPEDSLELVELESEQEQLLSWMLNQSEDEQEEDLDEMIDYDEYVDDEFSELQTEVEQLLSLSTDQQLRVGDLVRGTVFEVADNGAFVDVGGKAAGFVPLSECSFAKLRTPLEALRVGMQRDFLVVQAENEEGQVVLSLGAVEAGVFWQRIRQLHEEEVTVSVRVESANRGGLLVRYGPYDGFVPVSQFGTAITAERAEEFVGQDIQVKFLEVDEALERLVFSHKRASLSSGAGPDMQRMEVGEVLLGVVQSVKPYGAFVDVGGGLTGLLHVSQVSHERVVTMDRIVKTGDKIKVMVLSLDRERGRMVLSTKKLEATPGDMLRDPQTVFDGAEGMAAQFKAQLEAAKAWAGGNSQAADPATLDASDLA